MNNNNDLDLLVVQENVNKVNTAPTARQYGSQQSVLSTVSLQSLVAQYFPSLLSLGLVAKVGWARNSDDAEGYFRSIIEWCEYFAGRDHPVTLMLFNNLGWLLQHVPFYQCAFKGCERTLGPDHRKTLAAACNLGQLLQSCGKLDLAEPFYRRVLERFERTRGPDHPDMLSAVNNLGFLLQDQGKFSLAEPYYRRSLEGQERFSGRKHPNTLVSAYNLGTRETTISFLSRRLTNPSQIFLNLLFSSLSFALHCFNTAHKNLSSALSAWASFALLSQSLLLSSLSRSAIFGSALRFVMIAGVSLRGRSLSSFAILPSSRKRVNHLY